MLNEVIENTERFIASVPKAKRKKYGQFFTNSTTAKFMASLFCFDLSKQKIEVLDAGAGTGILAAAVVQKLYELGYAGKIYVTCYETDELVIPLLEENMALCNKLRNVSYTIKRENYITSQNISNSPLFCSGKSQNGSTTNPSNWNMQSLLSNVEGYDVGIEKAQNSAGFGLNYSVFYDNAGYSAADYLAMVDNSTTSSTDRSASLSTNIYNGSEARNGNTMKVDPMNFIQMSKDNNGNIQYTTSFKIEKDGKGKLLHCEKNEKINISYPRGGTAAHGTYGVLVRQGSVSHERGACRHYQRKRK